LKKILIFFGKKHFQVGISGEPEISVHSPEIPKNTWKKSETSERVILTFILNLIYKILCQHDFQMTPSVQFFLTL